MRSRRVLCGALADAARSPPRSLCRTQPSPQAEDRIGLSGSKRQGAPRWDAVPRGSHRRLAAATAQRGGLACRVINVRAAFDACRRWRGRWARRCGRRGRPWIGWAAPCRATLPSVKSVSAQGRCPPETNVAAQSSTRIATLLLTVHGLLAVKLNSPSARLPAAVSRHRSLAPLLGKAPSLGRDAFVAPSAAVIGDVQLGSQSSVFYGTVVRGERGASGCLEAKDVLSLDVKCEDVGARAAGCVATSCQRRWISGQWGAASQHAAVLPSWLLCNLCPVCSRQRVHLHWRQDQRAGGEDGATVAPTPIRCGCPWSACGCALLLMQGSAQTAQAPCPSPPLARRMAA